MESAQLKLQSFLLHVVHCGSQYLPGRFWINSVGQGFLLAMGKVRKNTLEGLADAWDAHSGIRKRTLKDKSLIRWCSPKLVGVPTMESLKENVDVMKAVISIWCPQSTPHKTIKVDDAKIEAPYEHV